MGSVSVIIYSFVVTPIETGKVWGRGVTLYNIAYGLCGNEEYKQEEGGLNSTALMCPEGWVYIRTEKSSLEIGLPKDTASPKATNSDGVFLVCQADEVSGCCASTLPVPPPSML